MLISKAQRYEFSKFLLFLQSKKRTRSLMDKIKDSGSLAQGSIPCGFTDKKAKLLGFFYCFSVMITSMAPTPNLAMLAMRFSVFL